MRRQDGAAPLAPPIFRIEEDAVFDERPAEVAAKVIVAQLLLRLAGLIKEVGCRFNELLRRNSNVDNRPLRLAEFGAEAVAFDVKLRDGVYGRKDQQRRVRANVHIVDAVNRPHVGVRGVAVDYNQEIPALVQAA
jgi:hypothetical protein